MKPKDIFEIVFIGFAAYISLRIAIRYADISVGILMIVGGALLFIYRHPIGDYSFPCDYLGEYNYKVHKPTPGCLLIPFAIAIIAMGAMLLMRVM